VLQRQEQHTRTAIAAGCCTVHGPDPQRDTTTRVDVCGIRRKNSGKKKNKNKKKKKKQTIEYWADRYVNRPAVAALHRRDKF